MREIETLKKNLEDAEDTLHQTPEYQKRIEKLISDDQQQIK